MFKERVIYRLGRLIPFLILLIFISAGDVIAQKRIMPFGNSITWGKSDGYGPAGGEHGYRDELYDILHTDYSVDFTGPGTGEGTLGDPASPSSPDDPYLGYYIDGTRIDQFLPGSTYDVEAMLDGMSAHPLPDIILMHLGTNDIGTDQPVGSFDDAHADSSMMGDLNLLMRTLLDYNNGGHTFEQIFLCKIIPAVPYNEYPGFNAKVVDYNSKIQEMYDNHLGSSDRDRVTLINMFTPFYKNQFTYYNVDDDPSTTGEDHYHPNPDGYEAMAAYFSDYVIDYLAVPEIDEFARSVRDLNVDNNWVTTINDIWIKDVGESGGGAINTVTGAGTDWTNLAIWETSLGLNSVSMKIHSSSTSDEDTLSGVGILFGMNSTDMATTDGYMAFVRNGDINVYVMDDGAYNLPVGDVSFADYSPGDVFKVVYSSAPGNNIFYFYLNGGSERVIYPSISLLDNSNEYYSGVIFRDGTVEDRLLVDYFKCESQLIDLYAPSKITNFYVLAKANTSMTLQWSAVGDDGDEPGRAAASYDLRYSMTPITSLNFEDASIVGNVPPPKTAGETETFTVKGLLSGKRYYFAIKAIDLYGNQGELSDDISSTTKTTGQVVDDLADLDDWDYDPVEYGVSGGELVNLKNDEDWGSLAIYKGRTNPTIVHMVWGDNVTNPGSGVENGGLIVLADDSLYSDANGYFIFVRTVKDLIYLFDIDNGVIGNQLDVVAFDSETLGNPPDEDDTLTVVIDNTEDTYNKFDVYMNGQRASRFSLYDTRTAGQRHGSVARNYTGVILGQFSGIRDNGVASFVTSGEPSGAAEISAAGPTDFQGTVNKWLQDSTAVCQVQLRDENNLPMQGIPVFFQVTGGGGEVNVPYTADEHIRIEAEWGNPVPPMIELEEGDASGGKYIISTQRGGDNRGYTTYKFYIESAGTYYFWGRVRGVSYWNTWVFQFELAGKTQEGGFAWWLLHNDPITGDWQWDMVKEEDSSTPYSVELAQGTYTLKILTGHENVQLDKLLITSNPAYVPTGKETVETLLSDEDGQVATAWKLGVTADDLTTPETEGENTLEARTFSTDHTVVFTGTGQPDEPVTIEKNADDLEGSSGDTLELPVTLYDTYSNKAFGQTVTFEVILGDGWLADGTESVVTDDGGQATALLVLGPEDSLFQVQASFSGYTGPDVIITAKATSGLVAQLQNMTSSQSFYVNDVYPNYLKAKVIDDQGEPVIGIPVRFVVTQGDASVGEEPTKWTDNDGIVQDTLFTGATAGIIRVVARTSRLETTVVNDSVFYRGAKIKYLSGSGFRLDPDQLSPGPLRAVVLDESNIPVPGHPVTYVIARSGTGFKFHNGSEVFVDTTDGDGIAKQVYVKAGSVHGTYTGIVEASTTDGFQPIPDSPVEFTCHVKSLAHEIAKIDGDNSIGVVGSMVGPLKIQMLKTDGNPIGGQPVTFRGIAGGGSFDPETSSPKVDIVCDENGYATVYYWLGSEAGSNNNLVVAYTINVDDSISTVFRLSAKSSAADTMLALSPTTIQDVVAKPQIIQVQVKDVLENNVKGEEVVFTVTEGGGALNGSADPTAVEITDSSGIASVVWNLGTEAGTLNNVLEAVATDGISPISGAPVVFQASAGPDVVSMSRSTIDATNPVQAVPDSICHITVTLLDDYGNPVQGEVVEIDVDGEEWDIWQKTTAPSDSLGRATSFLQSPTAGEKIIWAIVGGDTLETVATVIFLANDATEIDKYTEDSGDGQTGNVGTVLRKPFVIQITDGFNPVPYGPVYFSVLGDKGEILENQPVVSDSNGLAKAYLKLDTTPGVHYVQVSSPGLSGSPTFSATGKVGQASGMDYPYEGYDYDLEGTAGEVLPVPFVVKVFDDDGLAVAGEEITFIVDTPGSDGAIVEAQPVSTDEYGYASAYYRMQKESDTLAWIKATHSSFQYFVWYKAVSQAGRAKKLEAVSSIQQTAYIGSQVNLKVRVTDNYGNPRSGVTVQFEITDGTAVITHGALVETDISGEASAQVLLGFTTGPVKVWASGTALEGSPVEFSVDVITSTQMAEDIIRFPQTMPQPIMATVNEFLVDSLRAMVIDTYGNGVPGQTVIFRRISGEGYIVNNLGQLVTTQLVTNKNNGIAAVRFKAGPTPETTTTVTAEWTSSKKDTFYIRTVNNPHFPELDKSYIYASYNPDEGKYPPLKIPLIAEDQDPTDVLTFEIGNPFPPEGIEIVPQSDTSAIFQWSPNYDQAGVYDIILRVVDNRGGYDQKTTRIFVQNVDRLPSIISTIPVGDTTLAAGQTVMFWVNARDPDGDVLSYSWKINGLPVQGNQSVYYYAIDKYYPTGTQTVDAFVSDGLFTISHRWSLTVTTSVEISNLMAQFVDGNYWVKLSWTTSREVDNIGFDVFRSHQENDGYIKINDELIESQEGIGYTYTDRTVQAGHIYYYKIVDTDIYGNQEWHGPLMVKIPIPNKFELFRNYPNPFNPVTTIRYELPRREKITLTIYNILGQDVITLIDGHKEPGYHIVEWDGRDKYGKDVSTGIYIYRLRGEKQIKTRRMVKIR